MYKKKKIGKVVMTLLTMSVVLCFVSCGHRHPHPNRKGRVTENYYSNERNENRYSGGGGCSRSRSRGSGGKGPSLTLIYHPVYFMQNVEVNQGDSFQEALYQIDPKAKEEEQKYDVGGTKLIAEMSADVGGIYYSRNQDAEVKINILSLDQLKLYVDHSKTSVYQRIINQQIVINNSCVGLLNGFGLAEIFENFVNTLLTGKLVVHFTIANITNKSVLCEIKQGQMLEAVNENVQNLVVAETTKFSIAANQQTTVDIRVYCAARHRGDPSNSRVRFTPYLLNASNSVYESQSSVWTYIENDY